MDDALHERGKAMENRFFREQDAELLKKLRAEIAAGNDREALGKASGISDDATLDSLLQNGVTPEAATAISLIPLVAVAWADNVMEAKEIAAILKAAAESGLEEGSVSHELLQSWLQDRPDSDLLDAWKGYTSALRSSLEPAAFMQLGTSILARARDVAKSAGGFLGLASIGSEEREVLEDLEKALG